LTACCFQMYDILCQTSLWSGQRRSDFSKSDSYMTNWGCLFFGASPDADWQNQSGQDADQTVSIWCQDLSKTV